jgi:hypothetical protein
MVHYSFIVTEVDSENIMEIMRDSITKCDVAILDYMADSTKTQEEKEPFITYFKSEKVYLRNLINSMTHTKYNVIKEH